MDRRSFLITSLLVVAVSHSLSQTGSGCSVTSGGNLNCPGTVAAGTGIVNGVYYPAACSGKDAPAWCSGSDMGAWINSACTALNTAGTGGRIQLPPGTFYHSTPIVCDRSGKAISLQGAGGGYATELVYTPTTGIAATFGGGKGNAGGVSVKDISFDGGGRTYSTTGLQVGSASYGCSGCLFENVSITNFGTGLNMYSAATVYLNTFVNMHIQSNNLGATIAGESGTFIGGLIGNNVTGVSCATSAQATFTQTSFDDNTTVGLSVTNNFCRVSMNPAHFENSGGGTDSYLSMSGGTVTIVGADGFQSDTASGTANQMATVSGGQLTYAAGICVPSGRTITQLFNLSGSASAVLSPIIHSDSSNVCSPAGIQAIYNTSFTGGLVFSDPKTEGSNTNGTTYQASLPGITLAGTERGAGAWTVRENGSNGGDIEFLDKKSAAVRAKLDRSDNWMAGQFLSTLANPCTNGELSLSAGWGSSVTVTGVAGTGQTCQWTITSSGTGQTANPTITDALANPLPTSTIVCEMQMVGGNGVIILINQTTMSATAPVFTFNGKPAQSSTYIVLRRCGP